MTAANTKEYIEAVGRRKTSVARVRLYPAAKTSFIINEHKDLEKYFPIADHQRIAHDPFTVAKIEAKFKVSAHIKGGGVNSQAEALRHAIARALIIYDKELRGREKSAGYLKRDPRAKERRKFGLKKARKAPQWSKR
jgi:small subunit ribosomal protein S9